MARRLIAISALVVTITSPACRSADGGADPLEPGNGGTLVTRSIESGGRSRTFQLYVPPTAGPRSPMPLLIALHGNPGSANAMRQLSGFVQVAEDVEFLVAFPEATVDWNEGCGCTAAERDGVDDVRFMRDLVDAIDRELAVERSSVFAAGFSQGGLFAEHLACRWGGEVAAVAVVAATMSVPLSLSCAPAAPVPILLMHGDLDPVFPPAGTEDGAFSVLPVRAAVDLWVGLNGCEGEPASQVVDNVATDQTVLRIESHTACADGSAVAFYEIENGGHTWPGSPVVFNSGVTSREVSAQEEIALFFLSHRGGR